MNVGEIEGAIDRLEQLVRKVDLQTGNSKKHLLIRARNLAAALLDPYILFHTKIVVKIVKERGGDEIDEIAAWLHDIGRAVIDDEHRIVGALWAEKWLRKFYITDNEIERILDGIKNHGTKDEPGTATGKLLKLVDALAVFDEGWAYMIAAYYKSVGKPEKAIKMFKKKWKVVEEVSDPETKEQYRKNYEEITAWVSK